MKITTSLIALLFALPIALFADSNKVIITEFMAVNSNGIVDEDLEHSDWLELYNATDAPIDLAGWFLSDNAATLKEWQFPSVTLPKGGYMVVFASGKNRIDPQKTCTPTLNFQGLASFWPFRNPTLRFLHPSERHFLHNARMFLTECIRGSRCTSPQLHLESKTYLAVYLLRLTLVLNVAFTNPLLM